MNHIQMTLFNRIKHLHEGTKIRVTFAPNMVKLDEAIGFFYHLLHQLEIDADEHTSVRIALACMQNEWPYGNSFEVSITKHLNKREFALRLWRTSVEILK